MDFPLAPGGVPAGLDAVNALPRLRFQELPPELRARLVEADFLRACHALTTPNAIVWTVIRAPDPRANRSHELEWDPVRNDFVPLAERVASLPSEHEVESPEPDMRTTLAHELRGEAQHLTETIVVLDAATGAELVRASQDVYSPARYGYAEWMRQELARVRFPAVYAKWPAERQVAYWTTAIYRMRRSNGESGYDEDAALSPDVVDDLRRIDPHIDGLLPAIARQLARMEGISEELVLRKLRQRD